MFKLNDEPDKIVPLECTNTIGKSSTFSAALKAWEKAWEKAVYEMMAIPPHLMSVQSVSRCNRKSLAVGDVIMINDIRYTIEKGPLSEESFSR